MYHPASMQPLDDDHRYRCRACGNLTRFDVVERSRIRRFYHFTLAGEREVEEEDVLEAEVESLSCRWCQSRDVEVVERLKDEAG